MDYVSSEHHTKEWRTNQDWYDTGKRNECEIFQRKCIASVIGTHCPRSNNVRINFMSKELQSVATPLKEVDGLEWTEDFDGVHRLGGTTYYFNFKFVCEAGGAQTRTLRETYHFILVQLEHLVKNQDTSRNVYFINILDGDTCFQCMPKFQYLLEKEEFVGVRDQVFVGDTKLFATFWDKHRKKKLGQFYTTNYQYILQGLEIPKHVSHIVEPFVGAGDLLHVIPNDKTATLECYDIDPKTALTIQKDVFAEPPLFQNKFVITNPPFLARNKSKDKTYFDKYKTDDLYKCFMKELTLNPPCGGIVIIPMNFWCSARKSDTSLRQSFLRLFRIVRLNIFEEPVFTDTDYSVCSFQFEKYLFPSVSENEFPIHLFPGNTSFYARLNAANHFMIGGDIYNLPRTNQYSITRWTSQNQGSTPTNILVKCIDDDQPINMSIVVDDKRHVDNTPHLSARSYATLVIDPPISIEKQTELVGRFNDFLREQRRHHSLFLSSYREFKRKRISFDLVYRITGHLLETSL